MPGGDTLRFDGFADSGRRFFHVLARNQRRDWFEAHRDEYETGWVAPMRALLAELRERLDQLFPCHPLGEPKVFRIHRDVRFAKDKSPYKTHIGGYIAIAGTGGGPAATAPLYLHLGATELFACAGHYVMQGPQLARFRAAVADDRRGAALAAMLDRLERAGYEIGSHDTLRKPPRGVEPAHPRADLLRRKGLIVGFPPIPPASLTSRRLLDWLWRHARRTAPVVEWLADTAEAEAR